MRIQNNITAMNTHRMYTINNDNVAKSAEKLSSGYRINRAGDDAAGLAISEKMRSQIRGLNMATKNSQDAISLVQTAEGALQETQSMLQRMSELAVQAATGTNEGFDRTQAAKEFEQLKREINDVAEQTNFNNMKILDGSLSYQGYVRSASTAGVNVTVDSEAKVSDPAVAATVTQEAQAFTNGQSPEFKIAFPATNALPAAPGVATGAGKANYKMVVELNGKQYDVKTADGSVVTDDGTGITAAKWNNGTVTLEDVNGNKADFKFDNTASTFKEASTPSAKVDFDLSGVQVKLVAINPDDPTKTTSSANLLTAAAADLKNGVAAAGGTAVQTLKQEITVDQSKLQDGDSITIGNKTYTFYAANDKAADGTTDVYKDAEGNEIKSNVSTDSGSKLSIVFDANDETSAATQLAGLLNGNPNSAPTKPAGVQPNDAAGTPQTAAAVTTINAASSGNKVTMEVTWSASAGGTVDNNYKVDQQFAADLKEAYKVQSNDGGSKESFKSTVEFDVAKMKDGDKFTIKAGTKSLEVEFAANDTRKGFMDKVRAAAEKAGFGDVKGNALIVEDAKAEATLEWNEEINKDTNAIRIQVGANENEQLALSIDSMNTAGLGLDNQFLTIVGQSTDQNIDSAGAAITAVKAAINKVSDQRATLGAMQNRLDHKIANLKVSSENLSAAESRIRDVDMAQEMTNFTKNNILSQAATAMLAQANALPQNVLSLLG